MKLYLNLSDQAKRIVSCVSQNTNNRPAMVILNTDDDYGKYPKSLKKLFNDLGLTERSRLFRETSLTKIETGDFIIIGENPAWEDFDFQVVEDQETVEQLDGRRFRKVYDIIDDWKEIVTKLSQYGKYNTSRIAQRYLNTEPTERFQRPSGIDVVGRVTQRTTVTSQVEFAAVHRPVKRTEKVTIFDNWVKVGMKQYDIYVNLMGEEFIKLETGQQLYVTTDRLGRKFLVKR